MDYSHKCNPICTNFLTSDVFQGNASHLSRFLMYSKNSSELSQKTYFLAHSKKFFVYALLRPVRYTPNFASNETSYEISFVVVKIFVPIQHP